MRSPLLRVLQFVLLCVAGSVPAFFLVLVTLFSNHGGVADLASAYGLTLLAYLLLGFVAGLLWPEKRLSGAASLLLPAVIVAFVYVTREPQAIPTGIGSLSAALTGTLGGASLRLRARRR